MCAFPISDSHVVLFHAESVYLFNIDTGLYHLLNYTNLVGSFTAPYCGAIYDGGKLKYLDVFYTGYQFGIGRYRFDMDTHKWGQYEALEFYSSSSYTRTQQSSSGYTVFGARIGSSSPSHVDLVHVTLSGNRTETNFMPVNLRLQSGSITVPVSDMFVPPGNYGCQSLVIKNVANVPFLSETIAPSVPKAPPQLFVFNHNVNTGLIHLENGENIIHPSPTRTREQGLAEFDEFLIFTNKSKLLKCGGVGYPSGRFTVLDTCEQYNITTQEYGSCCIIVYIDLHLNCSSFEPSHEKLTTPRRDAGVVNMPNGRWWIMGGHSRTSEIFHQGTFYPGPLLPASTNWP